MLIKGIKEYQDVLIIIASSATISTKQNKLISIAIKTEDNNFKKLVNELIDGYKKYVSPKYISLAEYKKWQDFIKPISMRVKKYINDILLTQKPQWQIIAERNGWRCVK